jgi:hypothetical protein
MNMRKYLITLVILIASYSMAGSSFYQEDKELFERVCTQCHEMQWYLWPRTFKSWELTVENMRSYSYGEQEFSDDEALRIVEFLTEYSGEGVILTPESEEPPEVAPVVEPKGEEPPPAIEQAATNSASTIVLPVVKRYWRPSRNILRCARVSGFFAVACLLGLLGSGFKRKQLGINFRKFHVKLALGLFLALSAHGIIYIAKYGTPSVLWYWFGLIGFLSLVVTQVQGLVRKRFRKGLLISHIVGACLGLALSILHWFWAWL